MSMIDRVKKALIVADSAKDGTPDYDVLAVAAIKAMLEPSQKMIDAVDLSAGPSELVIERAWRAMISAALYG